MKILLFIFLCLIINPVFSHESSSQDPSIEKWYYQLTIGRHYEFYKGEINSVISRIEDKTSKHKSHGEINLIGLYMPILDNHKSLLGIKFISGGWDEYDDEVVALFFVGLSYQHYFKSIGKGLFVHTDFGTSDIVYNKSNIGEPDVNESGFASRFGIGYAVPVFKETSFLFTLHNTTYLFDIGVVNASSLNVGFLW